jgi:phosphoribosyl-dephospho-CoA transferase
MYAGDVFVALASASKFAVAVPNMLQNKVKKEKNLHDWLKNQQKQELANISIGQGKELIQV